MTAGYEYSPGALSSTATSFHSLPSLEIATESGVRPLFVGLYTSKCRPSLNVTASIPALGFGNVVKRIGLQFCPASSDHTSLIFPCLVRQSACKRLSECTNRVG